MSRILNIALVLLIMATIALSRGRWLDSDASPADNATSADNASVPMDYVKRAFPDATGVRDIDTSWVEVYDTRGQKIGEVMLSSPYSDKVIGYAGRTPLLIALDTSRTILQVQLLNNVESPLYVEMVTDAGVLNTWNGLPMPDALEKKVDNVTGSTYTAKAIVRSLQVRLAAATDSDRKIAMFSWYDMLKHFIVLLILGLALYSFFCPAKAKKFRLVLLLLSVAVLGFWQSSMLSLVQLFTWLANGIPLATQWVMLLILLFAVGLPMFTGKAFYCSYLCPFGAAQELVGKLNKRKIKLGQKVVGRLMLLRKAILIFIVLLIILGTEFDLTTIEPFSAFNLAAAPLTAIVIAGVSLALSVFITKPWCRFLCPTGQTLDTMKKEAVKKIQNKYFLMEKKKIVTYQLISIALMIAVLVLILRMPDGGEKTEDVAVSKQETMLSVIHNRKSVRSFVPQKEVSKDDLVTLVKAGMAAPTAVNKQPWAFIVVTERAMLDSLATGLPYAQMLKEAGAAIVVCGDLSKAVEGLPEFWVQDCSAATQNILLAVEAMGLGAVWTGLYPAMDRAMFVQNMLGLPETAIPLNVIPIGHPSGETMPKDKWKEENLHWEKW